MTLGAYDGQSTGSLHLGRQLDIGTTTSHVGSDSHITQHTLLWFSVHHHGALLCLTGQSNDVGLQLVFLGVEHLVGDVAHVEHLAQQLRDLDRRRTDEAGTARNTHLLDLLDDGSILLAGRLIDAVVHILADDGAVGGDLDDVELVDIPELTSLGNGSTCHTRQLVVHAEVVLQGDGSVSLCGILHLDVLFGLHCLVQTVAPASALHDTASLLIYNLHLAVLDDVVVVEVEHGVSLEQLLNGMYALALDGVVVIHFVLLGYLLLFGQVRGFNL